MLILPQSRSDIAPPPTLGADLSAPQLVEATNRRAKMKDYAGGHNFKYVFRSIGWHLWSSAETIFCLTP
jgi:hypothetical protein